MPGRVLLLSVFIALSAVLPFGADAAERISFQNRMEIDATVTFAARPGEEAFKVLGNVRAGRNAKVPAEKVHGCDRLFVQPYFDSSFQFFLPFTLDQARAVAVASLPPTGESRRLAPFLTALVGDDRISVPAGLPLPRFAALMAQGMNRDAVENLLVALRLPGEQAGRYAVAIGETTWGYREEECEFTASPAGVEELAELWLTTARAPKALGLILEDMKASGLKPLLLTVEGRTAKAFGPEGLALEPKAERVGTAPDKAWEEAAKAVIQAVNDTPSDAPLEKALLLAGSGLLCTFSFGDGDFALQVKRE